MRVGVLSARFPPEPAFVPGCLAEELARRGHEVRVLTGFPAYPDGRIYPGYRQRWNDTTRSGSLTVRRGPRLAGHDGSSLRRLADQATFALSSGLAAPGYLAGVDVLYVHLPPPGVYAAAALLRLLRRVPTVVHLQDVWPMAAVGGGPTPQEGTRAGDGATPAETVPGWGDRLADRVMRAICRSAAGIVVTAPSMGELVVACGADPAKVRVVLNWTDERLFRPARPNPRARREIGHRGRPTVMYAGSLGSTQRLETAIRAAAMIDGKVDLDVVVVGAGAEEQRLRRLAAELAASNVRFLGWRFPAQVADLYGAADYQLVVLRDLPQLRGTVPAKLPAALSAGTPVVVSAGGDTADLVERARAGLSCRPEDPAALADRFALAAVIPAAARREMARRARDSYLREMSMRAGVDRIEQLLAEAAHPVR
jgi:colanic acid biosynthesis glycosyl transferase WcaI